jgi:3-methylcrotonyl-CoA carboxylase alpha subunit
MNTRLQVEHPVTEAITGLDLVEWQLRVACGEPLPLRQDQITMSGYAMEARVYAEDPPQGFLPSTGPLLHMTLPSDARVDSGFEQCDVVSPYYDPMIAKLIVHADDRPAAAAKLAKACAAVQVWPVKTNAAFLARCAGHPDFIAARLDTDFIGDRIGELVARLSANFSPATVAALAPAGTGAGLWGPRSRLAGFRVNGPPARTTLVYVDGVAADLPYSFDDAEPVLRGADDEVIAFTGGAAFVLSRSAGERAADAAVNDGVIRAPMPGRIAQVRVAVGDHLLAGQIVLVLEAMKMEHALTAPFEATVTELSASMGEQVVEGASLARLEPVR